MAISVFIVDDHYMVVEGIRSLLQNEQKLEWAGHAMNAASCLAFLKLHRPDIILMDINLPDKSGIELCKEVKENHPSVAVIGLSTFNQYSFIHKMMENGAMGYVLKNATREELMEAIETVAGGKTFLSFEAVQTVKAPADSAIIITRREKEILELIAEGFTNTQIAARLFISVTTVETHRKNLLSKFAVSNTAALVKMAAKNNFI